MLSVRLLKSAVLRVIVVFDGRLFLFSIYVKDFFVSRLDVVIFVRWRPVLSVPDGRGSGCRCPGRTGGTWSC